MKALDYIEYYKLHQHPEGGYYKETYRSAEKIRQNCLPANFEGDRNFSTAIYYLLEANDFSAFHKIKSDECWHFYAGGTLLIHVLTPQRNYFIIKLGSNIAAGETFQAVVPKGCWFAAEPAANQPYCFVGCTVSPGFAFEDFEMADQQFLLQHYPQQIELINRLTR